ncbi:MAG: PspC domain-containing protein [Prevotella sp.]|jgi:phage shock protein PspC (stress-responsive transcriptional regulator)|nr:PspC domain-containing protein [Prevotella sp.]
MKPTVRVSIGGLAFNLDEDAYRILNNYLQALRKHFATNPEGDEIISDIESRLSELLQVRVPSTDGVVSEIEAQEIIKVMGNPKDFDDSIEPGINGDGRADKRYSANMENDSQGYFKKRLYRDTENKVIGGVCSGLSHYFRIDPTVIRLLFAGIFLLLFTVGYKAPSCMFVVLIYTILWIVMPAAKTFTQKISMTGSDPSIMNIEDRMQTSKKYRGSALSTLVTVFINVIVGLIAIGLFMAIVGIIASFLWLHFDTELFGLNNYLILTGFNSINFKIAIVIASLLPFIGLLALMIKILRRSPFTTQTMVSLIIGLVFWLGSVIYIGNIGVKTGRSHRAHAEVVESFSINNTSDSLFVRIGKDYLDAEHQPNNPALIYKGKSEKGREISLLPIVRMQEDTTLTNYMVDIHKKHFADNDIVAKRKAESLKLNYMLTDSLLTVNPRWYSNSDPWSMEMFEIVVRYPRNKKVIIEDPLNKSYDINSITINGHDYHSYHNYFYFD